MSDDSSPLVDTHAHIYRTGMPISPGGWVVPGAPNSVEDYLAVLDAHHVPFAVIAAMSAFGDYNDYTLDALGRHKRLRASGIATSATTQTELKEMADAGMHGIRFMLLRCEMPDFEEFGWKKLLTRLSDLGMYVHVLIEPERLDAFLTAMAKYYGLSVVVDHFGFPDVAKGIADPGFQAALRGVDSGRVWIKMSGWPRMQETGPAYAAALLEHAGPERLMWGTDWPFLAASGSYMYADAIAAFKAAVPDWAIRRSICETALRFHFF